MSITIAIVEDNPLIAEFLAEALSDEGYTVRVFGDGRSALEAIIAQPPTLVLLDLNLPSMTGEEVLMHIRRQLGTDLPVVIMTASMQLSSGVRQDATAFLTKPFDLPELMICIATYVAPHRAGC